MNPRGPHQADLRKGRISEYLATYSVTKCLAKPSPPLHPGQRQNVVDAFFHARNLGFVLLHAFVVMPDHWHCLLTLSGRKTLSDLVHAVCRHASLPTRQTGGSIAWEEGFHDRRIRSDESVANTARYIESNPVRRGLVEYPGDWPWSSAHERYARGLDREQLGFHAWEWDRWTGNTRPCRRPFPTADPDNGRLRHGRMQVSASYNRNRQRIGRSALRL